MMDLLNAAVETGCEGLMIKDGASLYEPAKRSSHWLKLKKDYLEGLGDTFDLVVMGAWLGRGKRAGMFGAYLLGTYNADTGGYETVARVGTGLSDEVLAEWWTRLNREGLVRQTKPASIDAAASLRPDVWIEP
jgi:DNA ligase-1